MSKVIAMFWLAVGAVTLGNLIFWLILVLLNLVTTY